MATIETSPAGTAPGDVTVRPLEAGDLQWMLGLLDRTCGRHRVSRGAVLDAAILPGLVAMAGPARVGLVLIADGHEEIEIVALAATSAEIVIWQRLLDAVIAQASADVRRVFMVLTNAELAEQRLVQQVGLSMCTARPGAIRALRARHGATELVAAGRDGLVATDEIEFDLLVR